MQRITSSTSSQSLLYRASRFSCVNAKRHLNTEKPLYFSVSKSCAKEPATPKDQILSKHLAADKRGSELLDKLSASNKAGSTVITTNGKNEIYLVGRLITLTI